jgi:hypothetical protein
MEDRIMAKKDPQDEGFETQGIAAGVTPDAWTETALVAIDPVGYGSLLFETISETIEMDEGEKPVEWIPNLKGGRIAKFGPKADTEITLELYPIYEGNLSWPAAAATAAASGVTDLSELLPSMSDPFTQQTTSINRVMVRLCVTWCNNTAATNAIAAVASPYKADRVAYADGYITKVKKEFTDGIKKTTVTLKFPATDKAGNSCHLCESSVGTNGLLALSAYTTTTKFR